MVKKFKTIHMPTALHAEIEELIRRPDVTYKTVGEVCRIAGQLLINQYNLRQTENYVN